MNQAFNPQFAKIGEILINNGKATESGINEALAQQKSTNEKIGTTLVEMGLIEEDDFTIEVVHTPGHASNHLCYILKEEKLIFTGDHIMNGSTVVIGPPDGNMKQYIQSLEKLKDYDIEKIAPGHGELLDNPHEVAEWIINHRLEREKKVFQALKEATRGTPDSLVERVYDDVDSSLFPIAKASLLAHLIKLEEDNLISRDGEEYFT